MTLNPNDLPQTTRAEAAQLAERFTITVAANHGRYAATIAEFPTMIAPDADTREDAIEAASDMLVRTLAGLMHLGQPVPAPRNQPRKQVNIRLAADEHAKLADAAAAAGMSVSAFVRHAAVNAATRRTG